jgi:hypothetical protein
MGTPLVLLSHPVGNEGAGKGSREKKSDESDVHLPQPRKKSSYFILFLSIFLIAFLGVS